MAKLIRECERYEGEVRSKHGKVPSLSGTTYIAAVDRSLLGSLIFISILDKFAAGGTVDRVTDVQGKRFITSIIGNDDAAHDPARTKQALSTLIFLYDVCDTEYYIIKYYSWSFTNWHGWVQKL